MSTVIIETGTANVGSVINMCRRLGDNPDAVSAALGHHDVAFTLRTYAHLLSGMHSEAMNAIGNLIFGPPATGNVTRSVT